MATALLRVPGDFFSAASPPGRESSPSVTATIAVGRSTDSSTESPVVFTIIVWPDTSAPGEWPVCSVVIPKPRTHSMSRSRGL